MSTNFGSSPSRGKKDKSTSFSIFVRECRRHDVYSRLWTLLLKGLLLSGRFYSAKKLSLERSKPAQWSRVSLMICTSPWKTLVLVKWLRYCLLKKWPGLTNIYSALAS